MIIHAGSTSGVEAEILNKPVFLYRPSNSIDKNIAQKVGFKVSDKEELLYYVEKVFEGQNIEQHLNELKMYLHNYEVNCSAQMIVNIIDRKSRSGGQQYNINLQSIKFLPDKIVYFIRYILLNSVLIHRFLPTSIKRKIFSGKKLGRIKYSDIRYPLRIFDLELTQTQIKKIAPDTFLIRKI